MADTYTLSYLPLFYDDFEERVDIYQMYSLIQMRQMI